MSRSLWKLELGANLIGEDKVRFKVWAPHCRKVEVKLEGRRRSGRYPLEKQDEGYFSTELEGVSQGDRYTYLLDSKKERPDPISRYQPDGVHGPSSIVDPNRFGWKDRKWKGLPLARYIFYELHVGTFTPQGTFEAAIEKIPYLRKLGITVVELMPVAQFPGERNWGYDGVGLYAVQESYGGLQGLKRFVDACHREGLAVCLDVVYNHLGPEGNYLADFGPYFTNRYHTPWGDALNYDWSQCGPVRRFVIDNALYWVTEFHVDALRLDAIHGIFDFSTKHILEELNDAVTLQAAKLRRRVHVIAESDLNDSRIIRPKKQKGYGLDAQWSDDFHHAIHAVVTDERRGYYRDFGRIGDIVKAHRDGFVYDGKYSAFRKRRHGNSVKDLSPEKLVVCSQNHDQIGNRAFGERLGTMISFESQKTVAALVLLAPYLPLLFMGEEYGETAPFQYFFDHGDPKLVRAVQEGRRYEFLSFGWKDIPDPDSTETFSSSKLQWRLTEGGKHRFLLRLYTELIALRKKLLRLGFLAARPRRLWFDEKEKWMAAEYAGKRGSRLGVFFSFSEGERVIRLPFKGTFVPVLQTEEKRFGGKAEAGRTSSRKRTLLSVPCAVVGQIRKS